jgi:hypothetical protein
MCHISLTDFNKIIDNLSFDFIHDDICCIQPHRSANFHGSVKKDLPKGEFIFLEFQYDGSWTNDSFVLEEVVIHDLDLYKDENDNEYALNDSHKEYLKKVIEKYINSI